MTSAANSQPTSLVAGSHRTIELAAARVPALALDCESEFYDCTPDGNESYAKAENYRPTVVLGDIFFENLIDCSKGKPPKGYLLENAKPRPKAHCFEEYAQLNRYLRTLADRYPNLHLYPANHFFTSLVKYPHSIFYNEGTRQTFFSRQELTWDGWHPYTDPGTKVLANLTIMYLNRLIQEGKVNGSPIPLAESIPGARAVVVPGRSHLSCITDDFFKGAVMGFLGYR